MFEGKTVVITGGASGIGAAMAKSFGSRGARIALIDFDKKSLDAMTAELSGAGIDAFGVLCDVTEETQCVRAMKSVIRRFGGIDVLINNAGITQRSLFRDTSVKVIRRVMEVNFFGSVNCTRAALESIMERKGMIIVTTSIAGIAPLYGRTGYAASKHALHGFFESLRSELKSQGVHVMMVSPGFTLTNLQTRALDGKGDINRRTRSIPGSQATPESVAEAVYRGACRKKRSIILTIVGKISYLTIKFMPAFYERSMVRTVKSEFE